MIFLTIFYHILKHFQIKIRERETCKGRSKPVHVDSELLPHWTYEMKVSRTLIKVCSQSRQSDFTDPQENSLISSDAAQPINHVL